MRGGIMLLACLLTASAVGAAPVPSACPATLSRGAQDGQASDMVTGAKLRRIASGGVIHRFFDTSPVSPSGRYVALLRLGSEDRSPQPGEPADVIVVDLTTGMESVVAKTRGWEAQLGAQVQWGGSDQQLFFSDVDLAKWRAQTVILDPFTGTRRILDGPLFMASGDGTAFVGHDPLTSRFAQVGYGVVVPDEHAPRVLGPSSGNGVFLTDVASGGTTLIASAAQIHAAVGRQLGVTNPGSYEFYVFQAKWNPQKTRIMASFQSTPKGGGERRRSVLTMRPDGSEIRIAITPEQWGHGGHHMNWTADGEHVSINLEVDGKPGLEFVSVRYDGTDLRTLAPVGSGHPSQHPGGLPLFVTDAYPDEPVAAGDGTVPIRLLNTLTGTEQEVARVYVSGTGGEFRIDPHPAWDRTGRYVVFNGFVGCTRNVWMIDLQEHVRTAQRDARTRR